MRFALIRAGNGPVLAAEVDGSIRDLGRSGLPTDIAAILASPEHLAAAKAAAANAPEIDPADVTWLPPIPRPGKILCVGLNYADHAAESPYDRPTWPVLFLRVATSLIGHNAPILRPGVSDNLDFEGEMVVVIGKPGRAIPEANALEHISGYSIFNDGSIRDYQFKGPQWTLGKNFDDTGAFGPTIVTPDEVPEGGKGLRLTTKLNGETVQSASTDDLLFPLAEIIAKTSEAMTLETGDIIVSGTPGGVGFARKPPLFMKAGDVCEVIIEGLGTLSNPVLDEPAA